MQVGFSKLQSLGVDVSYRDYPIPYAVSSAQGRDMTPWLEAIDGNRPVP